MLVPIPAGHYSSPALRTLDCEAAAKPQQPLDDPATLPRMDIEVDITAFRRVKLLRLLKDWAYFGDAEELLCENADEVSLGLYVGWYSYVRFDARSIGRDEQRDRLCMQLLHVNHYKVMYGNLQVIQIFTIANCAIFRPAYTRGTRTNETSAKPPRAFEKMSVYFNCYGFP
jgi:hypothetical protein